jgi:hypothetical protein
LGASRQNSFFELLEPIVGGGFGFGWGAQESSCCPHLDSITGFSRFY